MHQRRDRDTHLDEVLPQTQTSAVPHSLLSAGNRAVSALIARQTLSVQRHTVDRPLTEDDPIPEESEELTVQRQEARTDDIPPPPPAFPDVATWPAVGSGDRAVFPTLLSMWALTCQDHTERGFAVMWNANTGEISAGDTQIGEPQKPEDTRARITLVIPPDRPPVYPVGQAHTHPPPFPGRTRDLGPSDIDLNTANGNGLPGVVEDFATRQFKRNDGKTYLYGKHRRET
jgi:hypothetical protein